MYIKESEPQTRFFGLVEKTDIDWHDCTQEECELWNERRGARRGSDEQTVVRERGEEGDDKKSDDREGDEEHEVTWYGIVVFIKGRVSSCQDIEWVVLKLPTCLTMVTC
jgi:hypothetical protein